ncbi:MAG: hypothetical protein ABI716_03715 [Candidatus Saccharibacteria bacterium]
MTAKIRLIETPEFARHQPKPELKLVVPLIELPDRLKADNVAETRQAEPFEIIDHVPGFSPEVETSKLESPKLRGEYMGGSIERIASRSGVPLEVVAKAALESMARQRKQS